MPAGPHCRIPSQELAPNGCQRGPGMNRLIRCGQLKIAPISPFPNVHPATLPGVDRLGIIVQELLLMQLQLGKRTAFGVQDQACNQLGHFARRPNGCQQFDVLLISLQVINSRKLEQGCPSGSLVLWLFHLHRSLSCALTVQRPPTPRSRGQCSMLNAFNDQ